MFIEWWKLFILVYAVYLLGFFLGKKHERNKILDGTVGVLAQVNKNDLSVDSVTYYYSEDAYDSKIKELKESGEEYYEQ